MIFGVTIEVPTKSCNSLKKGLLVAQNREQLCEIASYGVNALPENYQPPFFPLNNISISKQLPENFKDCIKILVCQAVLESQ